MSKVVTAKLHARSVQIFQCRLKGFPISWTILRSPLLQRSDRFFPLSVKMCVSWVLIWGHQHWELQGVPGQHSHMKVPVGKDAAWSVKKALPWSPSCSSHYSISPWIQLLIYAERPLSLALILGFNDHYVSHWQGAELSFMLEVISLSQTTKILAWSSFPYCILTFEKVCGSLSLIRINTMMLFQVW